MTEYDATEQALRNGFEAGRKSMSVVDMALEVKKYTDKIGIHCNQCEVSFICESCDECPSGWDISEVE